MIIGIPCSRKVFNIWATIVIIACFCAKFPGPILGFVFLVYLSLINYLTKIKNETREQNFLKTGQMPSDTVFSIGLALKQKLKNLSIEDKEIFKSQYDFLKIEIKATYPFIFNLQKDTLFTWDEINPAIRHIEKQIAFIKNQIADNNMDILEMQLDVYFTLLIYCYAQIYKDLKIIALDINKEIE